MAENPYRLLNRDIASDILPYKTKVSLEDILNQTVNTKKDTEKTVKQDFTPPVLPSEDFQKILELGGGVDQFERQRQGIDELKKELSAYRGQPLKPDLSILAQWADDSFGGNLAKAYKRPQSLEDKQLVAIKLQDMIQGKEGNLSSALKSFADLARARQVPTIQYIVDKGNTQAITDSNKQREEDKATNVAPKGVEKEIDEKAIERLSKRLEGIGSFYEPFKNVKNILNDERSEIPGVSKGYTVFDKIGLGDVARGVMGSDAISNYQDAQNLAGLLVKLRSGVAASEKEAQRIMGSFGITSGAGESGFRSGMQKLINEIENTWKQVEAGYKPQELQEFERRGGMTRRQFLEMTKPSQQKKSKGWDEVK